MSVHRALRRLVPSRQRRTNVSDARPSASTDRRGREVRYLVTMAFRVGCFVAMVWTPGWGRLVLLIGAAVLPYIAVIAASQADWRTRPSRLEAVRAPVPGRQLAGRPAPAGTPAAAKVSPGQGQGCHREVSR